MSEVVVFNPVSDLAGAQTGADEATLTWSRATPVYTLRNAGAEAGNASGWTATVGSLFARQKGSTGLVPPEGDFAFDCGQSNASTKAHQRISPLSEGLTIAQVDNDALHITVEWWGGQFIQGSPDQPQLNIYFYDDEDNLLDTHNSGFKNPSMVMGSYRWDEYSEIVEIPVGTRFIDIELEGRRNSGTYNDACFDDIRFSLEDAQPTPYVPGYALYQDGVLVATIDANRTEFVVSGLSPGTYEFQIQAYDGSTFLSVISNVATVTIAEAAESESYALFAFDDEEVFGGFFGGKLRGKTIACTGANVNRSKPCC